VWVDLCDADTDVLAALAQGLNAAWSPSAARPNFPGQPIVPTTTQIATHLVHCGELIAL